MGWLRLTIGNGDHPEPSVIEATPLGLLGTEAVVRIGVAEVRGSAKAMRRLGEAALEAADLANAHDRRCEDGTLMSNDGRDRPRRPDPAPADPAGVRRVPGALTGRSKPMTTNQPVDLDHLERTAREALLNPGDTSARQYAYQTPSQVVALVAELRHARADTKRLRFSEDEWEGFCQRLEAELHRIAERFPAEGYPDGDVAWSLQQAGPVAALEQIGYLIGKQQDELRDLRANAEWCQGRLDLAEQIVEFAKLVDQDAPEPWRKFSTALDGMRSRVRAYEATAEGGS